MARSLPARPDLAHLKKQAKALVRSGAAARLADAQRTIAREYGFASWTRLKQHIEALTFDPAEALVSAVRATDVDAARRLLERHTDLRGRLNEPAPGLGFGATFLEPAVRQGSRAMVDLLVEFGADVNVKSHWWAGGFGPLDVCSPEFAPFLVERGALLTAYAASRLGRIADLERLLLGNRDLVHERGGDGQTPLHVAATVEVARLLLEHGADIDALDVDHESTPAQYAIRERQDVARYLIERGGRTDILAASALGDIDRVQRFLDADPESVGVNVGAEYFPMRDPKAGGTIYIWTLGGNKTAHMVAREFGHERVYQLLLSRTPDSLKLALACAFADIAGVEGLLAARPNLAATLTERERQAIVAAAEGNKTEAVRLMLTAGWPMDVRRPRGATALHFAAWHGNATMVRELVDRGSSLDLEDDEYQATPLGWALHGSRHGWHCETGDYVATVDTLLSAGARPPGPDHLDASDEVLDELSRHDISVAARTTAVD
jgi:ankyrin repeat protein